MNGDNGDGLVAMSTRNQKKNGFQDPKLILNNITEDQDEAQDLVRDRIFHDFVENVVDPDQGPLKDDVAEDQDFVPEAVAFEDAEDGGSSEEELDKAEEDAEVPEDTEALIAASQVDNLQGVPSVLAKAYKKRFPNYWRTQQALVANSGRGYDQEDDPDFVEDDDEESSESSDESDVDEFVDDVELDAEGDKVKDLANMVEDMTIPDEAEDQEAEIDDDEEEEAEDDSADVVEEMNVVHELADETLDDYKSDEDPDFEPVEVIELSSDEESELSSIDEDDDESSDDASADKPEAGDENMIE